jgi:transcriptional regulator with XRE-family HTH domain
MAIAKTFGEFFKAKRVAKSLTLRNFCEVNGFDAGNISKIERGIFPPPHLKERLLKYAKALGIKEGSDDWLIFHDLAKTSAGKLPDDIVTNAELMNALPVLFRTARKHEVNKKGLERLIKSIEKELR